jgi:hypothetical protein
MAPLASPDQPQDENRQFYWNLAKFLLWYHYNYE